MKQPYKIYLSPNEYRGYNSLKQARMAFVARSIKQEFVVFVREDLIEFDLTVNNPVENKIFRKTLSNRTQVLQYLTDMF